MLSTILIVLLALFENGGVAWAEIATQDDREDLVSEPAQGQQAMSPRLSETEPLARSSGAGKKMIGPDELGDPDALAGAALIGVLGSRYAGTWFDQNVGRRQVAVVGLRSDDRTRVQSVLDQQEVDFVEVMNSVGDLKRLEAEALRLATEAGVDHMIGINYMENIVDGVIGADSWNRSSLAQLRGLALDSRGGIVLELGSVSPLYPSTNVGNARMHVDVEGGGTLGCTTGFAIGNGFGEFMTSAGHCSWGQTGNNVYNSSGDSCCKSTLAGSVTLSHQSIDVLAFWRPSDPKVWNGSEYPWVVGGANPQLSEPVCYRGATSISEQCGTVSRVNYTIAVDLRWLGGPNYNYTGFCMSGLEGQGGDSGSAVYRYKEDEINGVPTVDAKGLVASKFEISGGAVLTCGPTISGVLGATNSQLLVK